MYLNISICVETSHNLKIKSICVLYSIVHVYDNIIDTIILSLERKYLDGKSFFNRV